MGKRQAFRLAPVLRVREARERAAQLEDGLQPERGAPAHQAAT